MDCQPEFLHLPNDSCFEKRLPFRFEVIQVSDCVVYENEAHTVAIFARDFGREGAIRRNTKFSLESFKGL